MLDKGQREAIADHFRTHFAKLLDFATSLSRTDGGDILSEAYQAICEGRRAYDPDKPFEDQVRLVIDSIYKNRRKKDARWRRKSTELTEEELDGGPTVAEDEEQEEVDTTHRDDVIARCDEKERRYIEILERGVFEAQEQARMLNVTMDELPYIKRRVKYALDRADKDREKAERRPKKEKS